MAYIHSLRIRKRARFDIAAFIRVKYDKMVNRVNGHGKSRYKGLIIISRTDFYKWAKDQNRLYYLYNNWIKSNYNLRDLPTIDRIDSSKGYILSNMRWLSQSENSKLGAKRDK